MTAMTSIRTVVTPEITYNSIAPHNQLFSHDESLEPAYAMWTSEIFIEIISAEIIYWSTIISMIIYERIHQFE